LRAELSQLRGIHLHRMLFGGMNGLGVAGNGGAIQIFQPVQFCGSFTQRYQQARS